MKFKILSSACALAFAANSYAAPLFTVQEGAIPEALPNLVTADKLTLRYEAFINQTAGGSFTETGYFDATSLVLGNAAVGSQLNFDEDLLGNGYALYGKFSVSGNISFVGTTALATFNSGSFELFSDFNQDTTKTIGAGGTTTYAFTGDDSLLGSSDVVLSGSQANVPLVGQQAASGGSYIINYGDLVLTPQGSAYFISPSPFYLVVSVSGENESFNPPLTAGDYQGIAQGDASAVFVAVPEPATVALLGLGLLGMGISLRRKTK